MRLLIYVDCEPSLCFLTLQTEIDRLIQIYKGEITMRESRKSTLCCGRYVESSGQYSLSPEAITQVVTPIANSQFSSGSVSVSLRAPSAVRHFGHLVLSLSI